jgi:DHA1 family bicyclomycin/chloramphenicol resistance-like MFS transporter
MAASLQGFVSGMVNVVTAGVISPLVWSHPRWLALGMAALMAAGLASWLLFLRVSRRKAAAAEEPGPPV